MGKFPFRFLLPPVLLSCSSVRGDLARLSKPSEPAETLRAPSCHQRRLPGPGRDAGHQVRGGGRWVGTWLNVSPGRSRPTGLPQRPSRPADVGVPGKQLGGAAPFLSPGPRESPPPPPPRWAEDSSTLFAHFPPEAAWGEVVEGAGLGVDVPGAPHLHPESWDRSLMGPVFHSVEADGAGVENPEPGLSSAG